MILWLNWGHTAVSEGEGHRSTKVDHTPKGSRVNIILQSFCKVNLERCFIFVVLTLNLLLLNGHRVGMSEPHNCRGFTRKPKTPCSYLFFLLGEQWTDSALLRVIWTGDFYFFAAPDPQVARSQRGVKSSSSTSVTQPMIQSTNHHLPSLVQSIFCCHSQKPLVFTHHIVSLCYRKCSIGVAAHQQDSRCSPRTVLKNKVVTNADGPESSSSVILCSVLPLTSQLWATF